MNSKSMNQYYGEYYERCVAAILNKSETPQSNSNIPLTDSRLIQENALATADYIGKHSCKYTGRETGIAVADLILDNGENIELKRVSTGSGTYYNTSIYHMEKYGFNFRDYLRDNEVYYVLKKCFPSFKISETNKSPVSALMSHKIRYEYTALWEKEIKPAEEQARECFVSAIRKYFISNPPQLYGFLMEMIEKKSVTSKKAQRPDRIIIYNYKINRITEVNLSNIEKQLIVPTALDNDNRFSIIAGPLRIVYGWQNGAGLNNPTIRVFIRKGESNET